MINGSSALAATTFYSGRCLMNAELIVSGAAL